MKYVALRFDVEAADADRWSDALLDAGASSVDAIDPCAGTAGEAAVFAEPAAHDPAWWPVTRLAALCAPDTDAAAIMETAATALGRERPAFEAYTVADRDWVRATQAQFAPIRIADRFWIVPSWHKPPRSDALNIVLDPGLAFGTGAHATTRLCLLWLAESVASRDSVLDYGCGSGILAIAAAKLGAARVVGADIDPQAIVASRANAKRNGVEAKFVAVDELPAGEAPFDVVVANILANPIIALAPVLSRRLQRGGRIVLSGILESQADAVIAAYRRWFNIGVCESEDAWIALSGTRNATA